jgi:hypothetical protein
MQAVHGVAVLDGASEFRALMWDADTWMDWFRYRLPDSVGPDDAVPQILKRIQAHDGCFRVTRQDRFESQVVCPEARAEFFREYRIIVSPAQRSVHVMYASIDSQAELDGYTAAVRDFEREAGKPVR